jgi:hypothetical protein
VSACVKIWAESFEPPQTCDGPPTVIVIAVVIATVADAADAADDDKGRSGGSGAD